ncbi:hypothetical protein G4B88_001791 [Cannabis sativa]|uniref:Uncharacterized protein n=1 Tax=Cannabis sativa TaxID=3483 RepID=A0A7J6I200_CANSA|nr:hypothetical protein G4B88_001791 [Cannabis sativa]
MPAPKNPFIVGNSSQLRYLTSASSSGDLFNGRTTSLCVSLSVGSTSEVLIKSKPGDKIQLIVSNEELIFNASTSHPNLTPLLTLPEKKHKVIADDEKKKCEAIDKDEKNHKTSK